jgi:hypothetical protein
MVVLHIGVLVVVHLGMYIVVLFQQALRVLTTI